MAIFWIIQNLAMWHVTCWNESGRKLPTAYTSQQLLGGWGQRDIFFQFFCTQKTQKNMCIWSHTHVHDRHWNRCPKLVSGMSEILNFWDLKSRVLRCPKSYFRDISGKVRKSWNFAKSWKITKITKIPKIPKISKKSIFWLPECYHTSGPEIAFRTPESPKSRLSAKVRISGILCPDTKFQDFRSAKKSAKISTFRGLKISEILVCMPWERRVANGGIFRSVRAKKSSIFRLFRG